MNEDVTLARWLNDDMNEAELKEFMSRPEYTTYSRIKTASAQLKAPDANLDVLFATINTNKYKAANPKVKRLNPWLPRIAAILVLALSLTFFLYTATTTTQTAATGKRSVFLLPDDSQVTLNAASEVNYKSWNWSKNRRLELNGEAYFKVAKGQKFDVVTPLGTITVVGTQFNVKVRNNRLDVTCFEGRVKVTTKGATIVLTPGKTVAYKNGKNLQLPDVAAQSPGWLNYDASFSKESLQNVVAEMERQYKVAITIKTATPLPADDFNGSIPMNNIDKALDILQTIYHLQSKKAGDKIILTSE